MKFVIILQLIAYVSLFMAAAKPTCSSGSNNCNSCSNWSSYSSNVRVSHCVCERESQSACVCVCLV